MEQQRLIVLSVLVGVVAAGSAWFGWELYENLAAACRRARERRRAAAEAEALTRREQAEPGASGGGPGGAPKAPAR